MPGIDPKTASARRDVRMLTDRLARFAVTIGGISVIVAILLLFVYLLYEVLPLFRGASARVVAQYPVPAAVVGQTIAYAMDEYGEVGVRYTDRGNVVFFNTADGAVMQQQALPIPTGVSVTAVGTGLPGRGLVALGLSNGQAVLVQHVFHVSYPNDVRTITPGLEFPLGNAPIDLLNVDGPVQAIAVRRSEQQVTLVGWRPEQPLTLVRYAKSESVLDEDEGPQRTEATANLPFDAAPFLLVDETQSSVYAANRSGHLAILDTSDINRITVVQQLKLTAPTAELTALALLNGDISLLVADSAGNLSQWFKVRDPQGNLPLQQIRTFAPLERPIQLLASEAARKGFVATDALGNLGIYHATADRRVLQQRLSNEPIRAVALSPRADRLLGEMADGRLGNYSIDNKHPEVSFSALWDKVWYESYPAPDFVWQSTGATNDFEPKLSLTPLVFGTIKGAFYAMLLAIPVAIMGAIYTAYFMSSALRQVAKPVIEIMGAVPTVILGFVAGLWLAPLFEANLPGVFSCFLIVPIGVLVLAYVWQRLPLRISAKFADGWQPVLLMPVLAMLIWLSFTLSPSVEAGFFSGDMRGWLTNDMGLAFDQRNALVVGFAMGFAVIPPIFSISEDAIFGVPKHLTQGSLALGATPWQTLSRVVLLTASPGIFSAVMIGFGRAVGETMIVLMATGNAAVMDFSIFQGMRTLAANIAIEMPESEVSSTHFRVLFLAAFTLFVLTFAFNTMAELVRQRLRKKYSSL